MALLDQIEKQTAGVDAPCLCHNDLLAGNFIRGEGGIVIIDWEYAGAGDRFFDLGGFAANLKLAPENEPTLLRLYLGREPHEDELRRLRLMRLVSDLREATWNFVQQGREGTPEPPEEYRKRGHKLLGHFLAAAQTLLA
jgi:thiamine kinase-like enzyme